MYHASIQRLRYDEKDPEGPRRRFDKNIEITEWTLPGGEYVKLERKAGQPPSWWYGDEEASESFLQSVGAHLG